MRESTSWDSGDLFEGIGLEHFHHIQSSDRHVSELPARVSRDVDVIGDGAGVDHFKNVEWRARVEHHRLADILERQPDLIAVRSGSDIRAELAFLRDKSRDI